MRTAMPIRDARSLDHETLEEMRRLAVRRVLDGEPLWVVADGLEVHRRTVSKWMETYHRAGPEGLTSRKASGRPPALGEKQVARLRRTILGKNPRQLNFGSAFWTLAVVQAVIRGLFGVTLHRSSVGRVLDRMGLTPQVPVARAFQRDEEAIARWVSDEFPAIVREVRRKQGVLLFLDETGVEENQLLPHTWGERGQTPVASVSGNRRKVSVISALTPRGRLWFQCYRGTLNADRFIAFLADIQKEFTKKIVLVLDKHPAHTAAATQRYLHTVRGRLSVHFLPSYAPELNPDEHVWSYLKWMLRSDPLRAEESIDDKVTENLLHMQAVPAFLRRFFRDPNVKYIKDALGW